MKRYSDFALLAAIMIAISVLTYYLHYLIFRDPHHIFIFMVGDLAFVFLEVFLVVMVIERIITRREKKKVIEKLNMISGTFFSEAGNRLLEILIGCFENRQEICPCLNIREDWSSADFKKARLFIDKLEQKPSCSNIDLDALKVFMLEKRSFLLRLLENPNVLEHERGSDLLWAIMHLTEELEARDKLDSLPERDLEHISTDIQRVYRLLATEWIIYLEYLKSEYPYLFSLIVRTHPFQEQRSAVIT